MADVKKKRFNARAFTAFVLLLCALSLPTTGYASYELAEGPMTAARHARIIAPNGPVLLFIIIAVWHVVLLLRPLSASTRGAGGRIPAVNGELWPAVGMVAGTSAFLGGTAFL